MYSLVKLGRKKKKSNTLVTPLYLELDIYLTSQNSVVLPGI
jgi:hypothetical protein